MKEVFFIHRNNIDYTSTHFKTADLAEKYAKKMNFENYKVMLMYIKK